VVLKGVRTHTGCLYASSIRLNLGQLSAERRSALEQEIRSNPEVGMAAWTSMGLRKAIRWREYGKTYSSSWLAKYTHGVDTLAEPGTGCCRRDASCLLASILNKVLPEGDISP
jgi:hypothetical protein